MGQTFRAICPAASTLHVFELVSEQGRTMGWCTKCRQVWPLTELTDGKTDDEAAPAKKRGRGGKSKSSPRPA